MMQSCTGTKTLKQQRGALAATIMIIIAALLLLGTLAISIVVTDRNISRNQRMRKDAFYLTEAGHPVAAGIIEALAKLSPEAGREFSVASNLKNEVLNYYPDNAVLNDGLTDSPEKAPDISGRLFDQPLLIDVDRISASLLGGGSAEFAAGSEGAGYGGQGSKKILFSIKSKGCLRTGACSQVISEYRSIW